MFIKSTDNVVYNSQRVKKPKFNRGTLQDQNEALIQKRIGQTEEQ